MNGGFMWVHFRHFEKPSTGEYEQLNYSVGRGKNVIHYFLCAFYFLSLYRMQSDEGTQSSARFSQESWSNQALQVSC